MQIVITFDSLEEFDAFRGGKDTPVEVKPVAPKAEPVAEKPKEKVKPADPVEAVRQIIDGPTIDKPTARKVLADLNKKAGTNKAAELIKAAGYGKLTEVPDEALAGIVEEARKLLEVM